jgi:hypothetical protein
VLLSHVFLYQKPQAFTNAKGESFESLALWYDPSGKKLLCKVLPSSQGIYTLPSDSIPASWPAAFIEVSGMSFLDDPDGGIRLPIGKQLDKGCEDEFWRQLKNQKIRKPIFSGGTAPLQRLEIVLDSLDAILPAPDTSVFKPLAAPLWTRGRRQ